MSGFSHVNKNNFTLILKTKGSTQYNSDINYIQNKKLNLTVEISIETIYLDRLDLKARLIALDEIPISSVEIQLKESLNTLSLLHKISPEFNISKTYVVEMTGHFCWKLGAYTGHLKGLRDISPSEHSILFSIQEIKSSYEKTP